MIKAIHFHRNHENIRFGIRDYSGLNSWQYFKIIFCGLFLIEIERGS